jgi:putative endonuclease
VTAPRQGLGRLGERLAAEALERRGYEIVARNVRTEEGEIDLVTRLGEQWVFVEVRTRRGRRFGTPEESITPRKQAHMIRSARAYLGALGGEEPPWRIDFVAVELSEAGKLLRVEVIENAVAEA